MRVVLDTNILIRANPRTSPTGLATELLLAVVTALHLLVLSPAILTEVGRVLHYPHVQERWPLSGEAIQIYLTLLEEVAFMMALPSEMPSIVSDPDDDPYTFKLRLLAVLMFFALGMPHFWPRLYREYAVPMAYGSWTISP